MTIATVTRREIEEGRIVSIFAYWGLLFLVPLLAQPQNRFSQFHARQGLGLWLFGFVFGLVAALVVMAGMGLSVGLAALVDLGGGGSGDEATAIGIAILILMVVLWGVVIAGSLGLFVLQIVGSVNAVGGNATDVPLVGALVRRVLPTLLHPVPVIQELAFCPGCGASREIDAVFCARCGTSLAARSI